MWGGETFIPKIPSYRIVDVAEAIGPECDQVFVGIRPGEKLHEEMITRTDAINTIEFDKYFVILPSLPLWDVGKFAEAFGGRPCPDGFHYSSGSNTEWLTVAEIRQLIRTHVDEDFSVDESADRKTGRRLTILRGSEDLRPAGQRADTTDEETRLTPVYAETEK